MRIPSSLLARLLRGSQCRHHRVQLCEPREAGHGQHWPCGDNVTIRFVVSPLRVFSSSSLLSVVCHMSSRTLQTDNPGPWFLHCNIDFHLVAGLAIVFAKDAPDAAHVNPVPGALVVCSVNLPSANLSVMRHRGVEGAVPQVRRDVDPEADRRALIGQDFRCC